MFRTTIDWPGRFDRKAIAVISFIVFMLASVGAQEQANVNAATANAAESTDYCPPPTITENPPNQGRGPIFPPFFSNADKHWRYQGIHWLGVGRFDSEDFLRDEPTFDGSYPARKNLPLPKYYTTLNWKAPISTEPNMFAPAVINSVYERGLWQKGHADEDFASRTIFMNGISSASIANLQSGLGITRPTDTSVQQINKYFAGARNQAIALRGWTTSDRLNMFGAANIAQTAFRNDIGDTDPDNGLHRDFVNLMAGSENDAWIGRAVGTKANGELLNAQQAVFLEDDYWNLVPAEVNVMAASNHYLFLDNKKATWDAEYASGGAPEAGRIYDAVALQTALLTAVKGSWINVVNTTGFRTGLASADGLVAEDGWFASTPEAPEQMERCGSVIGSWIGIEVQAPALDPAIDLQGSVGGLIDDQTFDSSNGGGAPVLNPALVDPAWRGSAAYTSENGASLVMRGHVIIGDGATSGSSNGYSTDVLHVRDVLHLAPRSTPPTFSSEVPPADRVGLIYFDAVRNCPRISVAAALEGRSEAEGWRTSNIIWVDIALDGQRIDPAVDVRSGGDKDGEAAVRAEPLDGESARQAMSRAGDLASVGTSPFIKPTLELDLGAGVRADGPLPATLRAHGFAGEQPEVYWRRRAAGRHGDRGAIPWRKVESSELVRTTPAEGLRAGDLALSGLIDFSTEGADGIRGATGQVIEIMAIKPSTGEAAGSSFML